VFYNLNNSLVGALVKGKNNVIIPTGETIIEPDDKVIMVTVPESVPGLQIPAHHVPDQCLEAVLQFPAEFFPCLGRIPDQQVNLGQAKCLENRLFERHPFPFFLVFHLRLSVSPPFKPGFKKKQIDLENSISYPTHLIQLIYRISSHHNLIHLIYNLIQMSSENYQQKHTWRLTENPFFGQPVWMIFSSISVWYNLP